MPTPPDPTNVNLPNDSSLAEQAQAELRALKAYIQTLLLPTGVTGLNLFRKNLLMNGGFEIDQRNESLYSTGVALTALAGNGLKYIADRWAVKKPAAATASIGLVNFGAGSNPVNVRQAQIVTTVGGAGIAAENAQLTQGIEAHYIQPLLFGTASALPLSLSFKVTSPVTGLHSFFLINGVATNRSYVGTFNILIANTEQLVQIGNIPGDIAGTWAPAAAFRDTDLGLSIGFDLGSGANFEAAAPNVWSAGLFLRTAACVKICNNVGTFKVREVQLEQAIACSPFEVENVSTTLLRCQRYYYKTFMPGDAPASPTPTAGDYFGFASSIIAGQSGFIVMRFPVPMRVLPSIVTYNPVTANAQIYDFSLALDWSAVAVATSSTIGATISGTAPAGSTAGGGHISGVNITANSDFF